MTRLRVRSMCRSVKEKEEPTKEDWTTYVLLCDVIDLLKRTQNERVRGGGGSGMAKSVLVRQFDEFIKQAEENKVREQYYPKNGKAEKFLFPFAILHEMHRVLLDNKARIAEDPELKKKKEKIDLYLCPVAPFRPELSRAHRQVLHSLPPGQSGNHTPPGQSQNPTPSGQSQNPTPPEQSGNLTPSGQSGNPTPSGQSQNPIPSGQSQNPTPPGQSGNPTPSGQSQNPTLSGQSQNPTPPGHSLNPTPAENSLDEDLAVDYTLASMDDDQIDSVSLVLDNLGGYVDDLTDYLTGNASNPVFEIMLQDEEMSLGETISHRKHCTTDFGNGLKEGFTNIDANESTSAATSQNMSAADAVVKNDVLVSSSSIPAAGGPVRNYQQPSYEGINTQDVIASRNSVPVFSNHVGSANDTVLAPTVSSCGVSKPLLAEMAPIAEGRSDISVQQPNGGGNVECKDTFQLTSTEKSAVNELGGAKGETDETSDKGYGSGYSSRASSATPPIDTVATVEHPSSGIDLSDHDATYSLSFYSPFDYVLAAPEVSSNLVESNQVPKEPSTGVKLEPKDSLKLEAAVSRKAPQLLVSVRRRPVPVITLDDAEAPPTSSGVSNVAATPALYSNVKKVFKIVRAEAVSAVGNNPLKRKNCDADAVYNLSNGRTKFVKLSQPELVSSVGKNSLKRKLSDRDDMHNVGSSQPKIKKLVRPANSNAMPSSSQLSSVTASRSSNLAAVSPSSLNHIIIPQHPKSNLLASSSQQSNLTVTPLRPAVISSSQKFTTNNPSTRVQNFKVTPVRPSNITILSPLPSNPTASLAQPPIAAVPSTLQSNPSGPSSRRVGNIKFPVPRPSSSALPVGERTESGMLVYMGNKRVNKVPISSVISPVISSAACQKTQTQKKLITAKDPKLTANVYTQLNSSASLTKPEGTQLQPLAPHNANITTLNDMTAYSNSSPFANSAHKPSPLTALAGPYFNNSFRANRSANRNNNNSRSNENSNSTPKRRGRKPKSTNNGWQNALGSSTSVQSSPVPSFPALDTSGCGVSVPKPLVEKVPIPSAVLPNTSQFKSAAPIVLGPRNVRSKTTKAPNEPLAELRKLQNVTAPVAQGAAARHPARRRRPANIDPAKREAHNRSERERRRELTNAFETLREILLKTEPPHKFPKVRILATSVSRYGEWFQGTALPVTDVPSDFSLPPNLKERRTKKIARLRVKRKYNYTKEQLKLKSKYIADIFAKKLGLRKAKSAVLIDFGVATMTRIVELI